MYMSVKGTDFASFLFFIYPFSIFSNIYLKPPINQSVN